MSALRPISAPFSRRWREFRIQYLPFVAFGLSVLAATVLWQKFALPRQVSRPNNPEQASCLQLDCGNASVATSIPVSFNPTPITNSLPLLSD